MKKILLATIGILLILKLTGCATGSVLVTGNKRPAIDVSLVVIYRSPPTSTFESIGIVRAEAEGWTQQEGIDMALQELKAQAAKVGANGIILTNIGQKSEVFVGSGAYGQPVYSGTSTYETLSGEAIYVH